MTGASLRIQLLSVMDVLRAEHTSLMQLNPNVPTYVFTDVHGDRGYLGNILRYRTDQQQSLLTLLEQKKANLVCLGDGMHTEDPTYWSGDYRREVVRSVSLMRMIMGLKTRYPESFHYLSGNHDDITNTGLVKYGLELNTKMMGAMNGYIGAGFSDLWHQFEELLPVMAMLKRNDGSAVILTHAAPKYTITPEDVGKKPVGRSILEALTWVDNLPLSEKSDPNHHLDDRIIAINILDTAKEFGLQPERTKWIIGHRDVVPGTLVRVQCRGQLIQIANRAHTSLYSIPVMGEINPRTQITSLT